MSEPSKPLPDQTKKPAAAKTKQPKTGEKKGGVLLVVIIVLLSLLGLVGFGYYWQYLALNAQQNQINELQKAIRGLDNHPTLVEIKQRILDQSAKLDSALAAQNKQIESIRKAFEITKKLVNRDQHGWVLAEVEYLMRLATVRLHLVHDIKGATEALIVADQRLADLADPAVLEVREVLANEITALKSLKTPDVEGVGLKLMSISKRVHLLPAAERPVTTQLLEQQPETPAEPETLWQRIWSGLRWLGLRRTDAPVTTAALQAELYYVEQKLMLELEYAKQAALRMDKEALNRHLIAARTLLEEHYPRDYQQVITMRAELSALLEADLVPNLPDISGSLRKLRELQLKYKPPQPVKTEAKAVPSS